MIDKADPGTPHHYDEAMLCANCLRTGAAKVTVGRDIGTQRDPDRRHVVVCRECATALVGGDFAALTGRFEAERKITR